MSDLRHVPEEVLRAELARRAEGKPGAPAKRVPIDWTPVEALVEQFAAFVASDNYCEDHDFKSYIYESAVSAVFGPAFWTWKNGRR